jgi:hypothetical protein
MILVEAVRLRMLRINAGHDPDYPLACAGSAVGYYLQDGKEPPGVWAGAGAAALGLTGQVDPGQYRALFGKLVAPSGEKLYSGRPPRYVTGPAEDGGTADEDAAAAMVGAFATPAEIRRTRAKMLGSAGSSVPFYDLTFSATKSVSLLQVSYAAAAAKARAAGNEDLAGDMEARVRAIDDAAVEAARHIVARVEQKALFVRTGHHSSHSGEWRDGAGAAAALFAQHDNRCGEPNLHVHIVLLNRAMRADAEMSGDVKWRSLYGRALWDEQLGLAAEAERVFARLLTLQGIPLVQREDGNGFEAGGVEQATMDVFSQRTKGDGQIDDQLAAEKAEYRRLYGRDPSARTLWEWRQHIAKSTRKAKAKHPPTGAERLAAWEQHSKDVNVQILSDLHEEVAIYGAVTAPPAELSAGQRARTIRIAVAEVQARHAAWTASQLLWELHRALPALPAGTDPVPVLESMAADVLTGRAEDADIVLLNPAPGGLDIDHLGTRASDGQSVYAAPCKKKYATTGILDAEQHILTHAAGPRPQLVHPERAEAAVTAAGDLDPGQAAALVALLTTGQAITLVRAAAGTGKTRLAAAFARAWAGQTGGLVHAVTVSENAARVAANEMEQAGAPAASYNLARFLGKTPSGKTVNPVEVGSHDVILLDEAGQIDTADWLRLTDTANRAGARIVAVGDEYQLGSINAGGMFPLLAGRLGALEIRTVHRFTEDWEKNASLRLREGDVTAIADYQARGRIHAGTDVQAMRALVLDWAADMRAGRDTLMMAQTETEVAELNRLAAAHLARTREAAGHRPGLERVTLADGNTAQVHDWIQARHNEHGISAGGPQWLANRDILQITAIHGEQLEVRRRQADGGWTGTFTIPAAYARESATLGYASTIYAAQGRTVDTGRGLVTPGMSREAEYVQATRGRDENHLYVVTGTENQEQQADPVAILAQNMARRGASLSATAELEAALDYNDHPARLIYLYQEITAPERASQLDTELQARLGADDYARYRCDPVRPVLHQAIRETQLAGHDVNSVLDQITAGSMTGARSIASALHGRLGKLSLTRPTPAGSLSERLPEAAAGDGPARQCAVMMDTRRAAIGTQLADSPPEWLTRHIRLEPGASPALQADFTARAGIAGFYRQAAGITNPGVSLGDRPVNNPELAMLFDQAAAALEIQGQDYDIRAASRADLETAIRSYTRAEQAAPPDMGQELTRRRGLAAELTRQAEQAEAAGDTQLAADSRTAASLETRQAEAAAAAQDTRDTWDQAHQAQRQAARDARRELTRRGIETEPHPRPADPGARKLLRDLAALDRALTRQHQAALDNGQPWPPRPRTEPEATSEPARPDTPAQTGADLFRQLPGNLAAVGRALDREQQTITSGSLEAQSVPKPPPARVQPGNDMNELAAGLAAALDREHKAALEAGQPWPPRPQAGPAGNAYEAPAAAPGDASGTPPLRELAAGLDAVGRALDRDQHAAAEAGQPWPPSIDPGAWQLPDPPGAARARQLDTEMRQLGTGLAGLATAFGREHDTLTATAQAHAGDLAARRAESRYAVEVRRAAEARAELEAEDDYAFSLRQEAEAQAQPEASPETPDEIEIG